GRSRIRRVTFFTIERSAVACPRRPRTLTRRTGRAGTVARQAIIGAAVADTLPDDASSARRAICVVVAHLAIPGSFRAQELAVWRCCGRLRRCVPGQDSEREDG